MTPDDLQRKKRLEEVVELLLPQPTSRQLISVFITYVLVYTFHIVLWIWFTNYVVGYRSGIGDSNFFLPWWLVFIACSRGYAFIANRFLKVCIRIIFPIDINGLMSEVKKLINNS